MKFLYTLAFLFGADNWKLSELPSEINQTLTSFNKSQINILDLGCGDGQECIALAEEGWQVIGVDFIPLAIRRAKKSAQKAQVLDKVTFYTWDVSKIAMLDLPPIQFAYDIGCFHLLEPDLVKAYVEGVSDILSPGGLFLLNAFTPRIQGKKQVGYDLNMIKAIMGEKFIIEKSNDHSYWRFPASWYWLCKR